MGEGEIQIKKKTDKIRSWLKNKQNIILLIILIFAIAIRLYYFFMTINQPLWWDEAAYGSLAKNYISHKWDGTSIILGESRIRPPIFPFLWSLLLRISFGEQAVRFLLELIPTLLSVFLVYLIGKEMYNKQTGILALGVFSALWIHLFYACRLLTENFHLLPLLAGVYFFVKANKEEFNYKYFLLALLAISIATLAKYTNGIYFFVLLIMLAVNKRHKFLLNKKFWIYGTLGLAPILLFFLINYISKGNIFPAFFGGYLLHGVGGSAVARQINFYSISLIPALLKNVFFIFFIIGLLFSIFELCAGYNFISKNSKLSNNLFLLLLMAAILSFFIFYLKAAEDRWLYPILVSMCLFSARGISLSHDFIKKYSRYIAFLFVLAVLVIGIYGHLVSADTLIKNRAQSFLQIKQTFEWLKETTPQNAIITGEGIEPYCVYYAERQYVLLPEDYLEKNYTSATLNMTADYLVIHAFTPQDKIQTYMQNKDNQKEWTPAYGFSFDSEQKQVAAIIYQRIR